MDQQKKLEIVAELFEVEEDELSSETPLEELGWDSMRLLACLVVFQTKVGKKLNVDELNQFHKVQDLLDAMDE